MNTGYALNLALAVALAFALPSSRALGGPQDGVVLGAVKFVDHGPDTRRFNFVLVAEGFRSSELGAFASSAQSFVNQFFSTPPFNTNRTCFNFWRIDVASDQSGADNPATCPDGSTATEVVVDTYFDAKFCSSGIRRLLTVNSSLAQNVLNAQVPNWDAALIIVNSTTYGGAGGNPAVTSLAGSWHNIALHEFGHSAFSLADEYDYWAGCSADAAGTRDYHSSSEPSNPNVTVENRADYVKWRHLFYPGIAIPTTVSTNCTKCDTKPDPFPGQVRVGLYEGAHYYHCSVYRPVHSCMMRNYAPFCPVCSARILQVLQPNQPGNSPPLVFSPRRTGSVFSIEVPSSVGKNYQLEFRDSLGTPTWSGSSQVPGDGKVITLYDTSTNSHRFYRVKQW